MGGLDLGDREGGDELGGVEGGKILVEIHCMREESVMN